MRFGHRLSVPVAGRMMVMLLAALLSACGRNGSEPAQRPPNDLGLAQCQLVDGTVLGEPTDPIMIDGVATQACRITGGRIPGGTQVDLKWSHEYRPLAWVLDGKLEIGESRTYATLDEFANGAFARLRITGGVLRAAPGSSIVVHRNGYLEGDIVLLDDESTGDEGSSGSGKWAGIVVNGIGAHPDCPADTSASAFCNIEGPYGYYGGLSSADARTHVIGNTILPSSDPSRVSRLGFEGLISGAGGVGSGSTSLGAALLLNAPQNQSNPRVVSVFDSASTAVEINGGYAAQLRLVVQNAQGPSVNWHHDFSGGLTGVFYVGQSDHPALLGSGGDVDLNGVTLIDRDFTAGTAISVRGGQVDLTNVLVQNFRGCLQLDAEAGTSLKGVAFGCLTPTVSADDGTDYAAIATSAALANPDSSYYEADPALTAELRVGNPELAYAEWATIPGGIGAVSNIQDHKGRDLRLMYPECMGIGTLLPEDQIVTAGGRTYRICQLSGTVEASTRLYSSFNGGFFAWVLDGTVSLGADFGRLSEAEQVASLAAPDYVYVPAGAVIYGRGGASLTVQPNVQLIVDGSAEDPVEITSLPGDAAARWGGVRIYGVDRAECEAGSNGVCAYAGARHLNIEYLRLRQGGDGRPALELYEVGPGAIVNYLEIAGSAGTALALHGGRANLEHVVLSNNAGDHLLWEHGYRGTIRHGLFKNDDASTGQALHGRNDSANHDAAPRSLPTLSNLTVIGPGSGSAILLEQGSGLLLRNSIVVDFEFCLDIDDAATAALQSSSPQGIAMIDVVLSCASALALEPEAGGSDYGHLVASSSSVYQLDPELDESFVASNAALPVPEAGYWGAVRGANDAWYIGWSGLGVLLSPECDGKGTLLDGYRYRFAVGRPFRAYGVNSSIEMNYKVCRLPSLVSSNLELTRYTGVDSTVNEDGLVVITESGTRYGINGEVTWKRIPVPTIWLLDSMVTVGRGAAELGTVDEVDALKADPIELTLQPGTWVMATENGGLHITRGARLRVLGEPMLEDDYCEYGTYGFGCFQFPAAGPVSIFGQIDGVALPNIEVLYSITGEIDLESFAVYGGYAPYAPLGTNTYDFFSGEHYRQFASSWRGITVDGFARNNRCEQAATAEPGSLVCNVAGELGHHGGYDDAHVSLEIRNLYMLNGVLRLHSVAGVIDGLNYQASRFRDEQVGESALIQIDGGVSNLRDVLIDLGSITDSRKPGTLIAWNHGYRGNLQYIYGVSTQVADGGQSLLQANGREYFIPLLRGANGDPGHENDLPRSLPTIANLSLHSFEMDNASGQMTNAIDSSLVEVVRGSGLHLYHGVMGAAEGDNKISDYCFKLDDTASERVAAGELLIAQLAASCQTLSDNPAVAIEEMSGVSNAYASSMAVFAFDSEQLYVDPFGPDLLAVSHDYNRRYPLPQVSDDFGHVMLDVSSSPTADTAFLQIVDYLGAVDYWIRP